MRVIALLLAGIALVASSSEAQRPFRGGGRFGPSMRMARPESFNGAFTFCRVMFRGQGRGDGGGWSVDYPRADQNLPTRLSELTRTPINSDATGLPNHVIVRLTDPELFHCPFIMMTEVGNAYLDEEEAAALRTYVLKGGFLWVDDFWGSYAWDVWIGEISKALAPQEFPIIDLPMSHPMFHTMFDIQTVPQIPSINAWMGMGGGTSERGADSAVPHARAMVDAKGRILVLMTHNTDFGDAFEREGDNHDYFLRFSVDGYAFGINVVLYAMTH